MGKQTNKNTRILKAHKMSTIADFVGLGRLLPAAAWSTERQTTESSTGARVSECPVQQLRAKLSAKEPLVVVKANWCPACQRFMHTLQSVSERLDATTRVWVVEAGQLGDEERELLRELEINQYPTIFVHGRPVDSQDPEELLELIRR